jgi:RNA polymerase sigma factor (sigma-70 family)
MATPLPPGESRKLADLIEAYCSGEAAAGEDLCADLAGPIRHAVQKFFRSDSEHVDDVLQDTLLAVLDYLRRRGGFAGNLTNFAVTIASNRCRDLLRWQRRHPRTPIEPLSRWIEDRSRSPLDHLMENEVNALLQEAMKHLDSDCRRLLLDYYVREIPATVIMDRLGLKSVQGVYYRRAVCLKSAFRLLKMRLSDRSLAKECKG